MEIKFFKSPAEFRRWLERHHDTTRELWVGHYKKSSGLPSITWPEAVDQALCFGWIDGIRHSIDEVSYRSRFTPRKPRSNWSAVNLRRVEALIREGLMQPAGLKAYEARKLAAPGGETSAEAPQALTEDYGQILRGNPRAWAYFQAQAPWYQRTASRWVMSAKKEETRRKRLEILIESSAQERAIPPLARK